MNGHFKLLSVAAVLTMVCIASASLIVIDDADADNAIAKEWYCYGYTLNLYDRSYNPATYSEIEWTLAFTFEGLDDPNAWTSNDYNAVYRINPGEHKPFSSFPVFVRENAVVNGTEKTTMIVVHVNPIKTSCFVRFMYDSDSAYQYVQFTGYTTAEAGSGYIAPIPTTNPARDGYTFDGWFMDEKCTVPYTESTVIRFSGDMEEIPIYPKWTSTGTPSTEDRCSITIHPVSGLDVICDGMTTKKGDSFSFVVDVVDGFRFDLTGLVAKTSDGTDLPRTTLGVNKYKFSIDNMSTDLDVFLTGYIQYFRVATYLDDVSSSSYHEWVLKGSSVEIQLKPVSGNSIQAAVYQAYTDITDRTVIGNTIKIADITGDILIIAHSATGSETDEDSGPSWVLVAIVIVCVIAAVTAIVLKRRSQ